MSEPYLQADSVSLNFPIFRGDRRSLKGMIGSLNRQSRINTADADNSFVEGIKNISLSLNGGDRLALIGSNGAGKTSLLKVLAGIYFPTDGEVRRFGTVRTLLGVGMGLDHDASGLENIYISHYLYGLRNNQISQLVDEIVDFCELEEFITMPVRTYSAGMRTRLAFAISTSYVPDILLIDEVFGAGDKSFFEKSLRRMEKLMKESKILVFASHNESLLKTFCNMGMLMVNGGQVMIGKLDDALEAYDVLTNKEKST